MFIKIAIDTSAGTKRLEKIARRVPQVTKEAVEEASNRMTAFVKKTYLSGGPGGLQVRSGSLYRSTIPRPVRKYKDSVIGGVIIGSSKEARKYARVHFSDSPTIIRPRASRYLTIPIPGSPAVDSRGVQQMKAKDLGKGSAFWYDPVYGLVMGKRQGRTRVPYFKLTRSATVYPVASPSQIANRYALGFRSIVTSHVRRMLDGK